MSHIIYAVKFEQTIIHQHVHYDGIITIVDTEEHRQYKLFTYARQ